MLFNALCTCLLIPWCRVTAQTGVVTPPLVIVGEGHCLVGVVAEEAVFSTIQTVGDRRQRRLRGGFRGLRLHTGKPGMDQAQIVVADPRATLLYRRIIRSRRDGRHAVRKGRPRALPESIEVEARVGQRWPKASPSLVAVTVTAGKPRPLLPDALSHLRGAAPSQPGGRWLHVMADGAGFVAAARVIGGHGVRLAFAVAKVAFLSPCHRVRDQPSRHAGNRRQGGRQSWRR